MSTSSSPLCLTWLAWLPTVETGQNEVNQRGNSISLTLWSWWDTSSERQWWSRPWFCLSLAFPSGRCQETTWKLKFLIHILMQADFRLPCAVQYFFLHNRRGQRKEDSCLETSCFTSCVLLRRLRLAILFASVFAPKEDCRRRRPLLSFSAFSRDSCWWFTLTHLRMHSRCYVRRAERSSNKVDKETT